MANPFLNIFSGALGEANTQRGNTQQLMQALQQLVFETNLRQMVENQDPLKQLLKRAEAVKAAETIGDKATYNRLMGINAPSAQFGNMGGLNIDVPPLSGLQQSLNRGLPNGLSLTGQQPQAQPQTPMSDYQYVPAGEINTFGEPKMKIDLRPEAAIRRKVEEIKAIESAKPYTADEIKVVSGLSLIPQIDKLIKLVEDKNVYEGLGVPFGASRISAFGERGPWQSFKRGLTAGTGREAGLILQDIKQIMFATGGQALTDPEILKLGPKMEPSYKTEKQWISDLQDVRQRIIEKARLMRPNPNELYQGNNFMQQPQGKQNNLDSLKSKYGLR